MRVAQLLGSLSTRAMSTVLSGTQTKTSEGCPHVPNITQSVTAQPAAGSRQHFSERTEQLVISLDDQNSLSMEQRAIRE